MEDLPIHLQRIDFKITGMDCADEVAILQSQLTSLAGIKDLAFQILQSKMTVEFDSTVISTDSIVAAIAKTGMRAVPWRKTEEPKTELAGWTRWGRLVLTLVSGALLATGFIFHAVVVGWRTALGENPELTTPIVVRLFYGAAAVAGAWFVAPKAWYSLRRMRSDMNLLMIVAIVGAMAIGEYFEAGTVAFLFSISLALESWSVARAKHAIATLMSIAPDVARTIRDDGTVELTDVNQVPVGTTIMVHPGDKFPLDGKLTKGETTVDQAPITGESMPVPKGPGSSVFAGTINQDGAVQVVSTRIADDSALSRIIRMVGDAQARRSVSEQWVDRFAHYYTPAVMLCAALVSLVPPLLFDGSWITWLYQGLVLLVIACPCALVISTPVSIVAAMTSAAKQGVLVKGGPFIELPSQLKSIAVDKTGTLTAGRPQVQKVIPLAGHSEIELLSLAASLESQSQHPLAKAIVLAAMQRGIKPDSAEDVQAIQGKGATANLAGRRIWLGSHRYLEERRQETPEIHETLANLEREGNSLVIIGDDERAYGVIALADTIRPAAKFAIEELRRAGIEHIVMLTGDNQMVGDAVGRDVGVDEVKAELLPDQKVAAIEELVRRFGQVAMVGDGVNDAPAMARASLGIAMGAAGTDAAIETADIALMGDDLLAVPWLIRHSRRTVAIIRQNIWGSLAVKGLFIALTLAGHSSMWSAIAADMGTSFVVIINGLRLLDSGKLASRDHSN